MKKSILFFALLTVLGGQINGQTKPAVVVNGEKAPVGVSCEDVSGACVAPAKDYSGIPNDSIGCEIFDSLVYNPEKDSSDVVEGSEKSHIIFSCHSKDGSWHRQFEPRKGIDFETEIHYSYETKSGNKVKDAKRTLKLKEITENGFSQSELYKSLVSEGAKNIKLSYVLVSKSLEMPCTQERNKVCSFNTCPPLEKKSFMANKMNTIKETIKNIFPTPSKPSNEKPVNLKGGK